jgi:hypothetical protein
MAALALMHKKFNLGLEIAQLKEGAMPVVTDLLLDKLAGQRLGDYFAAMKVRMGHHSYALLCTEMLKAVKGRAADPKDVPRFVVGVVGDRALQVQILVGLEYLPEALAIAEKDKNRQAIALILEAAERRRDGRLAARCRKLIGR